MPISPLSFFTISSSHPAQKDVILAINFFFLKKGKLKKKKKKKKLGWLKPPPQPF
jgi:hypothetical protein